MIINDDEYTLSTGTKFYANQGIIGINPQLNISEGYDSGVHIEPANDEDESGELTQVEREELADYMISLWTAYKNKEKSNDQPR